MIPRLLRADNLTPPTRTPWGGEKILERYKEGLGVPHSGIVGEAWEVSVEPSFPSRFADDDSLLADAISDAPIAWLGEAVARRHGGQTPLLIKLLDSADNLSVQVHPADGDPALRAGESGKPEGWIVLEADEGAGLYLGFKEGVSEGEVRICLEEGGPLNRLMNFVPVAPGDAFVIEAGTAHAIGRGVTLIEPQFVAPGRRGLTYRFWDWNRRYDAEGRRAATGQPRALHVERSLAVTEWRRGGGEGFVQSCRSPSVVLSEGPMERTQLINWPWFVTERWAGSGQLRLPPLGTMAAITSVAGEASLRAGEGQISLRCGQSAVVPAAAGAIDVEGAQTTLLVTYSPITDPA